MSGACPFARVGSAFQPLRTSQIRVRASPKKHSRRGFALNRAGWLPIGV